MTLTAEQTERLWQAVDTYCEWLTLWAATDPEPHTFTRKDFEPYTDVRWPIFDSAASPHVDVEFMQGYRTMRFEVSYGDDGGSADLLCFFRDSSHDRNVTTYDELVFMVQGFDTYLSLIYDHLSEQGHLDKGIYDPFRTTPALQGYGKEEDNVE
jgi:hypothetical protein